METKLKTTIGGLQIVKLLTDNYALLSNSVLLTGGNYEGEYCLIDDSLQIIDGYCHVDDDTITINSTDELILSDDAYSYEVVWSKIEDCYDYESKFRYGVIDNRNSTGYWYSRLQDDCESERNNEWYVSVEVANNNDVWYCENQQDYVNSEDVQHDDEDSEEENQSNNADYHGLTRKDKRTKNIGWSIGFEIEKEDSEQVQTHYKNLYDKTMWIKERDGSLNYKTGYELVSPIFSLYDNKTIFKDIEGDSLKHLINADSSSDCGGHINIGHSQYRTEEIFEGLSGYFPLLYAMFQKRLSVDYCKAKKKHTYYEKDKYSSIFIKDVVCEFRIFSRVKSVDQLKWRLKLMQIICKGFGNSEMQVLNNITKPTSPLFKHLRKMYTAEELLTKINLFVEYSKTYNNKVVEIKNDLKLLLCA